MSLLNNSLVKNINDHKQCAGCGNELTGKEKKVQHLTASGYKQILYCADCFELAKECGLIKR